MQKRVTAANVNVAREEMPPERERARATARASGETHRTTGKAAQAGHAQFPAEAEVEKLRDMDREIHGSFGLMTGGISLIGLAEAWNDWLMHLAVSPGKQMELAAKAAGKWQRLMAFQASCMCEGETSRPCIKPLPQDKRFSAPDWQTYPFNVIYQSFLLGQQWWHNATTGVPGVSAKNERIVEFYGRQLLDTLAPSNFPFSNPEFINRTIAEKGQNLIRGYGYFIDELTRMYEHKPPAGAEEFRIGKDIAATPGSVVFRNDLIELIQYAPTTEKVHAEPILIVPAWIMKYYILDLSPQNSLIRYLVGRGHTVFCISWKNPDSGDRDLSFDDYRQMGVMSALDVVEEITGSKKIHATGYCLGGTLLAIAAAAMARDGDERLASLTLFAAQADFTEAGELSLFVTESQLALIEDMMWKEGYLDQRQMAGAFKLLRSQDLIWSRTVREYMLGERRPMTDLGAWNSDATRMPYRMHSEYLRKLFLNNDFAEGRLAAGGRLVFPQDISVPVFAVATERDHIAPWRSVFKLIYMLDCDVTFVLASGGHNTGIVAPPGNRLASYKVLEHREGEKHPPADKWAAGVKAREGSWWEAWTDWLDGRSGAMVTPPVMGGRAKAGKKLEAAPGRYVLQT